MVEAPIRVLLVDDDEDEFVIIGDLLRGACTGQFDLNWVPTYALALEAMAESRCDVCLVDYRLGERSGLDLLAEVSARTGRTQFILLTGEGDIGVDIAATKAGAADYLLKGELTAAMLERSIRYAVERGRTVEALTEARERAHSLNLAKSAFVAAMSHEIRTPMNAILGMADMLWESPLNGEQRRYVEVFRRAGSALLALINDVLDLSKVEAGHLVLERIAFDLEDVLDQAMELTAGKARAKSIILLLHLSPKVVTSVMGDPSRLRQILINLLGNAVKFTDAGEVVLTARTHDSGEPGLVEFSVSDTGIGIPSDKLETIFDDFTQADVSTTRKYGGTGLGLGISRRLVEVMGGNLTASSTGHGSRFCFALRFDPAPETAPAPVARGTLPTRRVLLISDNPPSGLILRETLETWGLKTDEFLVAADALEHLSAVMANQQPFSLALVDSGFRGMAGFEAAAEIRRRAPELPVVMLISDSQPGYATRGREAGLLGFEVKPVSRARLLRLVREAIAGNPGQTEERPEPDLSAKPKETNPAEPARILVAEDSEDNRHLIRAYLKSSPYQLTFEEDGAAGVDRFAISEFDLILMDVQMPKMDGLAATRAIRAIERERIAPSIPIIALTASASPQDIERSANAGCDAHLSKPISKPELIGAIEKYRRHLKSPEAEGIGIEAQERLRNLVPEMVELLARSDFARLAILGHDLKGSSGWGGFPELNRMGAAVEQFAKQKNSGDLRAQMTALARYLEHAEVTTKA